MKIVGPKTKTKTRMNDRQSGVGVRQPLDAALGPADGGHHECGSQHHDRDDGHDVARGRVEDAREPAVDLDRAEAQRGGRTEGQVMKSPKMSTARRAGWRGSLLREDDRAEQVGHALAERRVGEREPDEAVQRPRMQAPVEDRVLHARAGRLRASRPRLEAHRRREHVRERLGHAPEDQPDAHTGREHHRDPRAGAELGALVVGPQPDPAVRETASSSISTTNPPDAST